MPNAPRYGWYPSVLRVGLDALVPKKCEVCKIVKILRVQEILKQICVNFGINLFRSPEILV